MKDFKLALNFYLIKLFENEKKIKKLGMDGGEIY